MLKDSVSNLPVIIVEKNCLYGILDDFILNNINNIVAGKWIKEGNFEVYDYKISIIPFSSLGNKNGLLLGFKPDYIKVYNDEEIFNKKGVVGIYTDSLGGKDYYNAIIGL